MITATPPGISLTSSITSQATSPQTSFSRTSLSKLLMFMLHRIFNLISLKWTFFAFRLNLH